MRRLLVTLSRPFRSGAQRYATDECRLAIELARNTATSLGHQAVRPDHLLLGVLASYGSSASVLLEYLGADVQGCLSDLREKLGHMHREPAFPSLVGFSGEAKDILSKAIRASPQGAGHVGTHHVLLVLLEAGDDLAITSQKRLGISPADFREAVLAGHALLD